jgi:septal ring factor EnvC (AmiA/AmiB activator)
MLLLASLFAQPANNADLDRIRGEIARLKGRLDEVRRQARSAQQELETVDLELDIRTRELAIAVQMREQLQNDRAAIQAQIATVTPRIERQRQFLARRLGALYRFGGFSYVRLLLAVDGRRDPLQAVSMLSYLVSRDARAVSRFESERVQLARRYADLADRQRRIDQMRRVVEDRQRAIAASHAQKAQLLASLKTEESGSTRELAELEEKARRLERLILVLSRQQTNGRQGALDVRSVQGALPWPVPGRVIEKFGRQRNAKFNTFTTNNGLKIGAAAGAPVQAVFEGTVLFSQWFKGYGNLIILDHGHRVFSLYGNLKAAAVNVGERVTAGQSIAGVGDSEETPPGFLYFEIRQDNRPEDPQKWLR